MPSDALQVAGRYSQQLARAVQLLQNVDNARALVSDELLCMPIDFPAEHRKLLRQITAKSPFSYTGSLERSSQDADIRLTVIRDAFDGRVHAVHFEHCLMQCIPVHQVASIKQCAIN